MFAMLNFWFSIHFRCGMVWRGFGFACDADRADLVHSWVYVRLYYAIHVKVDARTHLVGAGEICSGKTS